MEYRVLEGIFENDKWKSIQLLNEGHNKIYNREQVNLDPDTLLITTDYSAIMYDIDKIIGVQLYYATVEELFGEPNEEE